MSEQTGAPPGGTAGAAYEYDFMELGVYTPKEEVLAALNAVGSLGWQMVSVFGSGGIYRIWLMRQPTPSALAAAAEPAPAMEADPRHPRQPRHR